MVLTVMVACLALAATAAAEVRNGEFKAVADPSIEPEFDVTNAKASYDTTPGTVDWTITTAAPPTTPEWKVTTALYIAKGLCTLPALEFGGFILPVFEISASHGEPFGNAALFSTSAMLEPLGPATYSLTGSTTSLAATYPAIADRDFNCAAVLTEGAAAGKGTPRVFPISGPPPAPAPPSPSSSESGSGQATVKPPAPAPAKLAIVKPKPVELTVGKWKTVTIKVTNAGGTGTAQGSLRVGASTGINVRPAKQKLPALAPGASWVESVRVQLTTAAKQKSTLQVTGTASGLTAKSSLIVKSTG